MRINANKDALEERNRFLASERGENKKVNDGFFITTIFEKD